MSAKTILVAVAAALLVGCAGTPFNWDAARQIKPGMTEQQLVELLGRPYLVRSGPDGHTWVWSYADAFQGAKSVSVLIRGGQVVSAPDIPQSFK